MHIRLARAVQKAGGYQKCFILRAYDSLQIGCPQVLNRGLHLDFEVLRRSKLVESWGTQNEKKIGKPPTERLHFTCRLLQLLTSNKYSGTLMMGCVAASGVPDNSRRQPEATHEVFSWTRSCETVARTSPKIAQIF